MRKIIKEDWEKVEDEFPQHEYGKELYDYIIEMVEEIEENWDDYEGETAKDKVMDYLENVRISPTYFEQKLFDGIVSDLYYSWGDFAKDVAKCIDEPKKIYESRRIQNKKIMKESLDIKTYNGLRKCFERIDDGGDNYAFSGNWEMALGGYDTGYIVKYKDEEIFRVNYGEKEYEVLSDRLDKKEIEQIKDILKVTNEFKDYIDLISKKYITIYDMEFEEENDELYDELLDNKISYEELHLDNSADEDEVRKELIDYIEKNYDVIITEIDFDVEVDYK